MTSESSEERVGAYVVDTTKIDFLTNFICDGLGLGDFEVSVRFVDSNEILELNKAYRGKDATTDVLSFPQQEWDTPPHFDPKGVPSQTDLNEAPPKLLGDIVICPEVAAANADSIGQALDREACFLVIHGLLHLCGHDHMESEEEKVMLHEQKLIMESLLQHQNSWGDCVERSTER